MRSGGGRGGDGVEEGAVGEGAVDPFTLSLSKGEPQVANPCRLSVLVSAFTERSRGAHGGDIRKETTGSPFDRLRVNGATALTSHPPTGHTPATRRCDGGGSRS